MNLIDFAEKKAGEILSAHIEDVGHLTNEAHVTFGIIAAAMSGLFGYLLSVVDAAKPIGDQRWVLITGLAAAIVWLFVWGAILVKRAMMAGDVHHLGNEPKNLLNDEMKKFEVGAVREAECTQMQERIEFNRARNQRTGRVINRVRIMLLVTPFIFLAGVGVAAAVGAVAAGDCL